MAVSTYLRAAVVVVLTVLQVAHAQQCYYPNGAKAPDTEKPCSSADGSACCPDTWECMDNGLCYLPADKLYGRYSCTDKSWKSSGCPSNMCTYDMKVAGAEAITQCSNHDNNWCCDGDRTHVDCCRESPAPRPFFALQDPKAYGTAGGNTGSSAPNLASITGKASGSASGSSSPSSTAASNSASATSDSSSSPSDSSSATTSAPPSTTLSTTVSSGTAGLTTIVTTIIQPAASSSPSATPTAEKSSNVPVIVGCAVGIPLALALLAILTWLFRKRSNQKKSEAVPPYTSSTDAFDPASPEFAGGAKLQKPSPNGGGGTKFAATGTAAAAATDPGVPELAGGQGVGPERPVSMIPGKAEMDSGGGFAPGTVPMSPHLVGVGGGNGTGHTPQSSWGSAPPGYAAGYSPTVNQGGWAPGAVGSDPNAGHYQAYRPPGGGSGVPEMAELPSVRTPPEVVEMGNPSPPARGGVGAARGEYPGMAEGTGR